jgi:hypothetical protein
LRLSTKGRRRLQRPVRVTAALALYSRPVIRYAASGFAVHHAVVFAPAEAWPHGRQPARKGSQ